MSSKPHTDPVYKKAPKTAIKFKLQLNEEQKEAKTIIMENTISILKGKAGSGKSTLAAQIALDMLFKKEVEKIVITRPMVTPGDEADLGALPGDINSKLQPYSAPVYDSMYRLYGKEVIEQLVEEGKIEVLPISFCRGRNFSDAVIIIDESQNCTERALEMILTRICTGSKVILCGDPAQVDLKKKSDSGFEVLSKNCIGIPGFAVIKLNVNHRHPIVDDVLKIFSELR